MKGPLNTAFCLSFTLAMCETAVASVMVDPSGAILRRLTQFWATTLCRRCGLEISVDQRGDVNWDEPVIVMANHQSHLDIPVLYAVLPRPVGVIAKEELFRIPVFGSVMRGLRCVAINREDRRRSHQSIHQAADQVRAGNSVLVFPEGTRSPDGRVQELKKGPFHLVQIARVPVVPIGIMGTGAALAKDGVFVHPARIRVNIGAPIHPTGKGQAAREVLRQKVQQALVELTREAAPQPARASA